jgi:mono/diheme cytochrome c family protein
MKRTCGVCTVVAIALAAAALVAADKTVWDGVYTAAQAARGKTAYDKGCSSCHLPELQGGFGTTYSGTALKGQRFVQTWEDALTGLYKYVLSPPSGQRVWRPRAKTR